MLHINGEKKIRLTLCMSGKQSRFLLLLDGLFFTEIKEYWNEWTATLIALLGLVMRITARHKAVPVARIVKINRIHDDKIVKIIPRANHFLYSPRVSRWKIYIKKIITRIVKVEVLHMETVLRRPSRELVEDNLLRSRKLAINYSHFRQFLHIM